MAFLGCTRAWISLASLPASLLAVGCGPATSATSSEAGTGGVGAGGVTVGAGATGGASVGGASSSGGSGATGGAGGAGAAGGTAGAGTGGSTTGTGGQGATGGIGIGGVGGIGGVPVDDTPPSRPEGDIPSDAYPDDIIDPPRDSWEDGLISPTLESEHHNQPAVINGYLQLTGNARFSIYDISDPTQPKQLSESVSPDNCATCGEKGEGEAEGHQVGFAKYGEKFYTATISGLGIDTWDISNVSDPTHLQSIHLEGVNFGDFTEAVWGLSWQGKTIYVGGTNTGLHVLDASNPSEVTVVNRIPTSDLGGVSAGPLFAVGNVLVITTPKESAGIATLDISDPHNPIILDAIKPSGVSYIGAFYGHHAYLQSPLRAWDVLTDPTTIGTAESPVGTLNTPASEYMSFADGHMFLGLLRPDPGALKIDVSDPSAMTTKSRIWGRMNLSGNDDQFTVAVGNLLVMSDDQLLGSKYAGSVIGVHAAAPDTVAPRVDSIIPKSGATGQSTGSRIGLTFTDNIELATVDARSFIVRPQGGAPIAGVWGGYTTVLNFDPDEDLMPGTTYEVILPADRITDYVGNGIEEDFISTFTTR